MSANVHAEHSRAAAPGSHAHGKQRVLSSAPLLLCAAVGAASLAVAALETAAAGCLNNVRSASVEGEGLGSRKCLKLDCNLKAVHGARQCTSYPSSARTLQRISTVFERVPGAPSPPALSRLPDAVFCAAAPALGPSTSSPPTSAREHPERTSTATLHRVCQRRQKALAAAAGVSLHAANLPGHSHRVFP
jgi:hypothetical protein